MDSLIEFRLQQMKELAALVTERESLRILAAVFADELARSSERVELYLKGLPALSNSPNL